MMKMLKRCLLALPFLLLATTAQADYRPGKFGIGIGSGPMTRVGLSFKRYLNEDSIQATFGCHGWSCRGIGLSVDYLFELPAIAEGRAVSLDWHAGVGPGIGAFGGDFALAGSGALGLQGNLKPIPLDLAIEWRPTLHVLPDLRFDPIDFAGHVRFWFD